MILYEFKRWEGQLILKVHRPLILPYLRWIARNQRPGQVFDAVEMVEHTYVRQADLTERIPESVSEVVLVRYEVPRDP